MPWFSYKAPFVLVQRAIPHIMYVGFVSVIKAEFFLFFFLKNGCFRYSHTGVLSCGFFWVFLNESYSGITVILLRCKLLQIIFFLVSLESIML